MSSENAEASTLSFEVNGQPVEVPDDGASLLEVLRDRLGLRSAKDGCSPQGQCGCCTVLVDGQARVSCVTPARRVRDRGVTTLEGLDPDRQDAWGAAFCATGGSQCGFCTPGIIMRFESLAAKGADFDDADAAAKALQAHLCRCTGWQTIIETWVAFGAGTAAPERDLAAAAERAGIEGHAQQTVAPNVAVGRGGFADDTAPADALVAVLTPTGDWVVGETLTEARAAAGKVQGRRTTREPQPPLTPPEGDWAQTLQTSWVEPAYLEVDASWCVPGGEPATPLANGGAFGGKVTSPVAETARRLADEHGRAVRVLWSREDAVRYGPKRPPVAAGMRADGTGVMKIAVEPAEVDAIRSSVAAVAPGLELVAAPLADLPTSTDLRAVGWAEAIALVAAVRGDATDLVAPNGAVASARFVDGRLAVSVHCGEVLDEVVLRSYCIGAAHMGYSWVTSEALSMSDDGSVGDLTVRSFGVVRAIDTPPIDVELRSGDGPAVNGSDAVFAAAAAATWLERGLGPSWPAG
ncbi:MAG: 2Fe-2S iron-sulfur cluster binding domain-containing protein [Acidimicrobiales bacterium]|nr:2Fe-2S iron-sulfur cluster binding domain-containing protein [Acidimicrobiales bacterium]